MSRLEDLISDISYALDTLRAYRDIAETGCCNDCRKKDCEYRPQWGDMVRYNCPHYEGGNK